MEDLNNIWNADDELNDDQLMKYVKDTSTGKEANAVERKMQSSSLINDGIEGLKQFSSAEKINAYVQQVNEELHNNLADKKLRKKRTVKNLSWEIIAVIIILLLCILGYVIIAMMRK